METKLPHAQKTTPIKSIVAMTTFIVIGFCGTAKNSYVLSIYLCKIKTGIIAINVPDKP